MAGAGGQGAARQNQRTRQNSGPKPYDNAATISAKSPKPDVKSDSKVSELTNISGSKDWGKAIDKYMKCEP